MKKFIRIMLLALLCAACTFGFFACKDAYDPSDDTGLHYYRVSNDGDPYYVIDGFVDNGSTKVVVPSTLGENNEPVRRIKTGAFADNGTLTEIVIPLSVTQIDAGAFSGMTKLESLTLPFVGNKVKADGYQNETKSDTDKAVDSERLFGYVFGTEEYNFGVAMTQRYKSDDETDTDGAYVVTYYIPTSLKTVVITASDYVVPMYAFYGNLTIDEIAFTGALKGVGDYAFYGNSLLKKVSLPVSVERVGEHAYDGCVSLSDLSIFSDTASLGAYAFRGVSVNGFVVKSGFSVGEYCFAQSSINFVEYQAKAVPAYAFYGCTNLENVKISASVKTVGQYAFGGCSALEKFGQNPQVDEIDFNGLTVVNAMAFSNLNGQKTYTVKNLPTGVVAENVFYKTTYILG